MPLIHVYRFQTDGTYIYHKVLEAHLTSPGVVYIHSVDSNAYKRTIRRRHGCGFDLISNNQTATTTIKASDCSMKHALHITDSDVELFHYYLDAICHADADNV